MPAYVVGTIRVTDPERWQRYVERVGATFGPHDGRVLLRGVASARLDGTVHGDRVVVIEFPDVGAARRWHASPEYQSLAPMRDAGADVVLTVYEG
jgi:uncharacterized protein (DUF1330 family)